MPVFSVIIPLYRKEKYIEKCLRSVVDQRFRDFEIIVVDDGSKGEGLEIVKSFSDPRLRIIEQENTGVSQARNNGVFEAGAEWIAFLDADDWWAPDFLEKMLALIRDFPEAAVYSSSYYKVKYGKMIPANIGVEPSFQAGYIDYYKVYAQTFWVPVNCSFVVLRKEAFLEEQGFNPRLKFGEDFDLWLRLSFRHKFAFLNQTLAYSNQDVDSDSRAIGDKSWKKEEHVLFNLDYLREEEEKNPGLKYLLDGLRLRSLHYFYRTKQYSREVNQIISAVDFKKHADIYYFYYKFPYWITRLYFQFKQSGSKLKQILKKKRTT
ncbi:MAG: glycosyltransferase family 2 protein [Bacteroidota bacterium]